MMVGFKSFYDPTVALPSAFRPSWPVKASFRSPLDLTASATVTAWANKQALNVLTGTSLSPSTPPLSTDRGYHFGAKQRPRAQVIVTVVAAVKYLFSVTGCIVMDPCLKKKKEGGVLGWGYAEEELRKFFHKPGWAQWREKKGKKMLTATSCQDSVTWEGETAFHLVKLLRN